MIIAQIAKPVTLRSGKRERSGNEAKSPHYTANNPRRVFTDLPLGVPAAERAYLQNYNNGNSEYGTPVLNPAGIDLSLDVATELGLGYLENVWLEVYYTDLP